MALIERLLIFNVYLEGYLGLGGSLSLLVVWILLNTGISCFSLSIGETWVLGKGAFSFRCGVGVVKVMFYSAMLSIGFFIWVCGVYS